MKWFNKWVLWKSALSSHVYLFTAESDLVPTAWLIRQELKTGSSNTYIFPLKALAACQETRKVWRMWKTRLKPESKWPTIVWCTRPTPQASVDRPAWRTLVCNNASARWSTRCTLPWFYPEVAALGKTRTGSRARSRVRVQAGILYELSGTGLAKLLVTKCSDPSSWR